MGTPLEAFTKQMADIVKEGSTLVVFDKRWERVVETFIPDLAIKVQEDLNTGEWAFWFRPVGFWAGNDGSIADWNRGRALFVDTPRQIEEMDAVPLTERMLEERCPDVPNGGMRIFGAGDFNMLVVPGTGAYDWGYWLKQRQARIAADPSVLAMWESLV